MSSNRREQILDLLRKNGTVMLKELEQIFPDVSSMTLRRDIEYLESTGEAVKIKGGIRSVKSFGNGDTEPIYAQRILQNGNEKEKIASMALNYVETRRSIFIDSGTTALTLAKKLPGTNLFIVTSSPHVALEVSKQSAPPVNLRGGLLNRNNASVSGLQSLEFVKDYNFDIAFMVASAFSVESGFTCGSYSECELKKRIVEKANLKIVMVDSSKFGHSMPFTFAGLDGIDILITDTKPDDQVLQKAAECGVTVRYE